MKYIQVQTKVMQLHVLLLVGTTQQTTTAL